MVFTSSSKMTGSNVLYTRIEKKYFLVKNPNPNANSSMYWYSTKVNTYIAGVHLTDRAHTTSTYITIPRSIRSIMMETESHLRQLFTTDTKYELANLKK